MLSSWNVFGTARMSEKHCVERRRSSFIQGRKSASCGLGCHRCDSAWVSGRLFTPNAHIVSVADNRSVVQHNYRLLLAKHTPLVRPLDVNDPPGTSAKLSVPGHAVSPHPLYSYTSIPTLCHLFRILAGRHVRRFHSSTSSHSSRARQSTASNAIPQYINITFICNF